MKFLLWLFIYIILTIGLMWYSYLAGFGFLYARENSDHLKTAKIRGFVSICIGVILVALYATVLARLS